jgi:peptidoglycan/xylan/chitin deacetylase (PgdA/CDA1 family)
MGRLFRNQPTFSSGDWLPTLTRLPTHRAVALTIDDGPCPETTPEVLRLLKAHQAQATFFVSGERVQEAPELVGEIVAHGHDVFAHGWSHIRLQDEPAEVLHDEMTRTEALLALFRRTPMPYLVRLPYGSGTRAAHLHRAVKAWNPSSQLALWTHTVRDHLIAAEEQGLAAVKARCAAEVERLLSRRFLGGSILLLHEKPYNVDAPFNAEVAPLILETLLPGLAKRGLRIDRLAPLFFPSMLSRYVLTASV